MCCYGCSILGGSAKAVNTLDRVSAAGATCCAGSSLVVVLCVERAWRITNWRLPGHEHVSESSIHQDAKTKKSHAGRRQLGPSSSWQENRNLLLSTFLIDASHDVSVVAFSWDLDESVERVEHIVQLRRE